MLKTFLIFSLFSVLLCCTIYLMNSDLHHFHDCISPNSFQNSFSSMKEIINYGIKTGYSTLNGSFREWLDDQFEFSENLEFGLDHHKEFCSRVPSTLLGYMKPDTNPFNSLEDVERSLNRSGSLTSIGGQWGPSNCIARETIAILIPIRNRTGHLKTLLRHLHPFLQRQQINYAIFVIEQTGNGKFNRAKLFNVGFVEANRIRPIDCFVFHDVDHLPDDDRNLYTCSYEALQLAVSLDIDNYRLMYSEFFGAVSAVRRRTFEAVNGFSNIYWGWGAEDDDMFNRLKSAGIEIARSPAVVGRYTTLRHKKQHKSSARSKILQSALMRMEYEGLNSLHYKVKTMERTRLMTYILAELELVY